MNSRNRYLSRRLKRAALTASALLVSASAFAFTGATGIASASSKASTPKQGGNLTFLIQEFPTGWESSLSSISSYEGNLWGEITDKLVYVSNTGEVSPWLLTSWQQENAARTFILNVRHGVTFSDGEKLNAAAVVDNINVWAKGIPSQGIAPVGLFPAIYFKSAVATGPYTVKVEFYKPTLGFIPTLGYHGCIVLSPKTLAETPTQQANLYTEYGTGPFVVKSYTQGVSYTLVRRKDYNWGPAALGHTGPAYLNSITYQVVADSDTREQAVESGQADVDFNPNVADIPSLEAKGFHVYTPRYLGFVDGFQVNAAVAPTNSLLVRQALQHAINRTAIIKDVYNGKGWLPAESFVQSNVPGAVNDSALFKYDPTLAAKDLAAAGYTKGSNGYLQKNGTTLSLTLIPNPYVPSTTQEDTLIAQQFQALGIQTSLNVVPLANYVTVADATTAPPLLSVSRSFIDISTVGGILNGPTTATDWFGVGTSDKNLDAYAKEIESAYNPVKRDAIAAKLQAYVLNQGYFDPIVQQVQRIYLVSPKVHGIQFNGVAYANFYTAWLS
jgi:peptide/nickel transport system substrate-binding protein